MDLELGPGRVLQDVTEQDVRTALGGDPIAILSADHDTYIQCCKIPSGPSEVYLVEYQDGSLDEHYGLQGLAATFDEMVSLFLKYLHGDPSWRTDVPWAKRKLPKPGEAKAGGG